MLYCKEKWVKGKTIEVDAREMSDGTLRFLAIITAILLGKVFTDFILSSIRGEAPTTKNIPCKCGIY